MQNSALMNKLYLPKRDLNIAGLVLHAPLWYPGFNGSTFKAWDYANSSTHPCTVTGATWGIQGRTGDGTQYITAPHHASLDSMATLSVVVWFKCTSYAAVRGLVGKHVTGTNGCYFLQINNGGGSMQFTVINTVPTRVDSTISFAPTINMWNHIVAIYNGSGFAAYANGTAVTASGSQTGSVQNKTAIGLEMFGIGGGGGFPLVGTIGEVLIYKRALSSAEISNIYQLTKWRYQ